MLLKGVSKDAPFLYRKFLCDHQAKVFRLRIDFLDLIDNQDIRNYNDMAIT